MVALTRARNLALLTGIVALPGVIAVSCFPTLKELAATGGGHTGGSSSSSSGSGGTGGGAGGGTGGTGGMSTSSSSSGGGADSGPDSPDGDGGCMGSMTDRNNCGRCGHVCCGTDPLACQNGVCQPFVIATGNVPGPPVVDDTYIYWPDAYTTSNGSILRVPKGGGGIQTIATAQDHPNSVAVDATNVYWVTNINAAPAFGAVYKAPLGGGTVTPLTTKNEAAATWILVNASGIVFWDNVATNQIRKATITGTNLTTIASATDGVSSPLQMALDPGNIYWASRFTQTIQKATINGSGATTIATATGEDPVAVAVNATTIFWANYQSGHIQSAPLAGGSPTLVANSGGRGPFSIAADNNYVYWGDEGAPGGVGTDGGPNGSVRAAPVSGTGQQGMVLAQSLNPQWITIDAECIYYSDTKTSTINVVSKP